MAATQASYFSVVCWEDSGDLVRPTQQSETLACSVLRLEARDYVTPAFCSALAVDSCSGSAGVSQVNLRFPVKSRALLIKQNVLGSRPLQLERPWAKHWILWRKEPPITKGEVFEINKSRDVKHLNSYLSLFCGFIVLKWNKRLQKDSINMWNILTHRIYTLIMMLPLLELGNGPLSRPNVKVRTRWTVRGSQKGFCSNQLIMCRVLSATSIFAKFQFHRQKGPKKNNTCRHIRGGKKEGQVEYLQQGGNIRGQTMLSDAKATISDRVILTLSRQK